MERAGKILKDLLSSYTVEGGESYSTLYRSWDQLAGSPLADHIKVKDLKANQLLIEIDHPGWYQLFQFREKQILKKLQKSYPELDIKAFKVRVVPRAAVEESSNEAERDGKTAGQTAETGEQSGEASIEASIEPYTGKEELAKALNRLFDSVREKQERSQNDTQP